MHFKKLGSFFLSAVMSVSIALNSVGSVSAATVITENTTGTEDGYDYELWKDPVLLQ